MKNMLLSVLAGILLTSVVFCADVYKIDPNHSSVAFVVKHMAITNVRGNFSDYSGTINYDPADLNKSGVNVTIKAASINTGVANRDKHLRSADFFDVDKFPDITFVSKKITKTADGYTMTGTLTMHGIAKEVTIPFEVLGTTNANGQARIGFEGSTKVNRQDFKISWSKLTDNGGLIASNDVKIELNVEGVKQ